MTVTLHGLEARNKTFLRWSVVIPAYNEENRLPAYFQDIAACFDGRGEAYEVLVVDGGSRVALSGVTALT